MDEQNAAFSNYWLTPLVSGDYRLTVNQTSTLTGFRDPGTELRFSVSVNRFHLPDDQIYSVYPPRDSIGIYDKTLPHIVLHDPLFPWQQAMGDQSKEPVLPWTFLLVLSEDEPAKRASMQIKEALSPSPGTYFPPITLNELEKPEDTCDILELERDFFIRIMPTKEDLPYMAHVRTVNIDNKVTDPAVRGTNFSCLIANRYPKAPEGTQGEGFTQGVKHTAYLVSLDGYQNYIDGQKPAGIMASSHVRLCVLYSYSFTVQQASYDFKTLIEGLSVGTLLKPSNSEGDAKKILDLGYLPMEHVLRDTSQTVSWYRGPFLPCKAADDKPGIGSFSDAWLLYDPETGMFDTSYAAAWQMGKLLTQQNRSAAIELMRWRLSLKLNAVKQLNEILVKSNFQDCCNDLCPQAVWQSLFPELPKADSTGLLDTPYGGKLQRLNSLLHTSCQDALIQEADCPNQESLLQLLHKIEEEEADD